MIPAVLGFLTANNLSLLITPLQTYLAHLQFTEAQQNCDTLKSLEEGLGMYNASTP